MRFNCLPQKCDGGQRVRPGCLSIFSRMMLSMPPMNDFQPLKDEELELRHSNHVVRDGHIAARDYN